MFSASDMSRAARVQRERASAAAARLLRTASGGQAGRGVKRRLDACETAGAVAGAAAVLVSGSVVPGVGVRVGGGYIDPSAVWPPPGASARLVPANGGAADRAQEVGGSDDAVMTLCDAGVSP